MFPGRTKGEFSENFRASPFGDLPILLRLLPEGASELALGRSKKVFDRRLLQKERPSLPPKDSDGGANPYACAGVPGRRCLVARLTPARLAATHPVAIFREVCRWSSALRPEVLTTFLFTALLVSDGGLLERIGLFLLRFFYSVDWGGQILR